MSSLKAGAHLELAHALLVSPVCSYPRPGHVTVKYTLCVITQLQVDSMYKCEGYARYVCTDKMMAVLLFRPPWRVSAYVKYNISTEMECRISVGDQSITHMYVGL